MRLPDGFESAPPLLSYGGDLKATFCLLAGGDAVLSQHQGDLENTATLSDYEKSLALYAALFEHRPAALVADRHPDYASTRLARARAAKDSLPLLNVQHHHAHAAACLAENGRKLDAPPVLAVVLDGLGLGDGGTLWGGEFLLADYRESVRLGTFEPVALIGGDRAAREPWRNLYAHLVAAIGRAELASNFSDLEPYRRLAAKPLSTIDRMLETGLNVPRASSCGRMFDAVAAAVGITFDRQAYEGQSGALLEAAVDEQVLARGSKEAGYPFAIRKVRGEGPACIEPSAMWRALLADLRRGVPRGVIAARFHRGLARVVTEMTTALRGERGRPHFDTVALSGGCFQNRVLFAETERQLRDEGFEVLSHAAVPANDGGLALGQAAIAAARLIAAKSDGKVRETHAL
jgi:hydrogenase maturation protein HypF